jgi:Serine carboxypeptidase
MLDDPKGKMAAFYNDPNVQKALNVPVGTFWIECLPGAGRRRRRHRSRRLDDLPGKTLLAHDEPESVVPYIAELLDKANIQVLIYSGDRDMTTNSFGSEILLDNMIWDGSTGWKNNEQYQRGLWLPHTNDNTSIGGYMKQYNNLQFLIVLQSGHLVPYNRPQVALELITRFLGNVSFIDKELPKYTIPIHSQKSKSSTTTVDNEEDNGNQQQRTDDTFIGSLTNINPDRSNQSTPRNDPSIDLPPSSQQKKHSFIHQHTTIAMIVIGITSFGLGFLVANKQQQLFSKRRDGYNYVADTATI